MRLGSNNGRARGASPEREGCNIVCRGSGEQSLSLAGDSGNLWAEPEPCRGRVGPRWAREHILCKIVGHSVGGQGEECVARSAWVLRINEDN